MATETIPVDLSDEERRKLLKPAPSNDDIVAVLRKYFVSSAYTTHEKKENDVKILKELDSYDDRNFMVEIEGDLYLTKVNNGVESLDYCKAKDDGKSLTSVIGLQYAIMNTLKDNGIVASDPIRPRLADSSKELSSSSEPCICVESLPVACDKYSPCNLVVSVYKWVPGTTMSSLPMLPLECLADAGRFLGKLDSTLDGLPAQTYTAARRYHQWDGKNTADLESFLSCIEDTKRRGMIQSIIDAFKKELIDSKVGESFRKGVNHGDYNDANILLDSKFRVSGVIDFGDSVESWRLLDVTVAMAYAMISSYGKTGRAASAAAGFLRGFHSSYPFNKEERKHLVLLMACRLACSVTLGAYSYQKNPENKYLLFHAEPAWKTLEMIWGYDEAKRKDMAAAMNHLFDRACALTDSTTKDDVIDCTDIAIPDAYVLDWKVGASRKREPEIENHKPVKKAKMTDGKPTLTFVTGNKKKLEEVKRILLEDTLPFSLSNKKLDLPELQGDVIEIAKQKCAVAAISIKGPVITEDTSLCFAALKDLPGPFIKWFLDKCGHDGLNKMIDSFEDKSAYAQTVVAFCPGPGKKVLFFVGKTMGRILPRGKIDPTSVDPIFEPAEGDKRAFAEMAPAEKDALSHRRRAVLQLRRYLQQHNGKYSSANSSLNV